MTYRQAIQQLITKIDEINNTAEALRDCANEVEKFHWNHLRYGCAALRHDLNKLDNNLPDVRAAMQVFEDYTENDIEGYIQHDSDNDDLNSQFEY